MPRSMNPLLAAVLLFAAIFAAFAPLPSCKGLSPGDAAELLPKAWVESDRATHDAIAPRFLLYLDGDSSIDPEVKFQLEALVDDWELRLTTAEAQLNKGAKKGGG